jgi:hypothetical protein
VATARLITDLVDRRPPNQCSTSTCNSQNYWGTGAIDEVPWRLWYSQDGTDPSLF